MTLVAGVDGCKAGWVVAVVGATRRRRPLVAVFATAAELRSFLDRREVAFVGIDMPLGLTADGVRGADSAARARLGPRRSSLFPTPAHAALAATSWEDALARNRKASGKGLSKQAFYLLPKVRDVRSAVAPGDQPRFAEVHPETSFAEMATHVLESKKTPLGQRQRIRLVEELVVNVAVGSIERPRGCAADDLLDALAAAWTARRMLRGTAEVLGDTQARDPDGYRVTITV